MKLLLSIFSRNTWNIILIILGPIQDDLTAEILSIDKELNELGMEIHQSPIKNLPSASIKSMFKSN